MAGSRPRPTQLTRKTVKVFTKDRCKWLRTVLIMFILYIEVNGNLDKVSIDKLKAESQTANEGQQVTLHCYFTPANADIGKWYWKTNGSAITRSDEPDPKSRYSLANATDGTGNASLIIKSVTRWDNGKYICGVDDESTTSSVAQSDVCWLTVYYMENPKLEALGEKEVPGGAKVSLQCKLELSDPKVTTINWFHGNKKIEDDSDKYSIEDDILEITQFDKRDEGNYTCRAENEVFANSNGKSSNSIIFSLRKEVTTSMPIAWIPVMIIIVLGIIAVIGFVFYKKKQTAKLEDDICQAVTSFIIRSKEQRRLDRIIADLDIGGKSFVKALDFGRQTSLQMERGDSIKITFNSTYKSEHWCFQEDPGYHKPSFCINLELHQFEEVKMLYTSGNIKEDNCKRSSEFDSNEFCWEVNKIKKGVKGRIAFQNITDDDEGRYLCKLQINWESRQLQTKPETKFTFYGKTTISFPNVIFRNVQRNTQLRPIKLILSDNIYLFVENESEVRYIMSKRDNSCEDAENIQQHQTLHYPTLNWDDNANFLMESNKNMVLLSFAILPGIRNPYIVLVFISHGKNVLQSKLVAIFPKRSPQFHVISDVLETLHSEGSTVDLKFDNLSGIKLSTGRLVVGGWIKRREVDNNQTSKWKVKYLGTSPAEDSLMDVENQSYEYVSFIMWTDDEINWNLLNLKMDNAEDNMRFQITETGPNIIHVIISSLSSKQILYEGKSNDNFQTIKQNTDQCSEVPLVSFGLSTEKLFVCASSFTKSKYTSIEKQRSGEASVGDTTDSGEVRSRYQSSLFGRIFSRSTEKSTQNMEEPFKDQETENKDITEESSLINDVASSETKLENSKTGEETLDLVVDIPPGNSSKGISDNVKKRKNFKKVTDKFSILAKKKSKNKSGTGNNYEVVPTIKEDNKETLKRDEENDSSETKEQEDEITAESENQPKKSLVKIESQEKDEQKDEIVRSDLEIQHQDTSELSFENVKKRSTLERTKDKIKFLKKKKDGKEPVKGYKDLSVNEKCIVEEQNLTENGQKSEETERKDNIVKSDSECHSKTSLKKTKNPKKRKGNKSENQSSKADEQAPKNNDDVKIIGNQTLHEGSLEQEKAEDITDDAMSSNDMTSGEVKVSSKKSLSGIRNVLPTKWRQSKSRYSTTSNHEEAVMIPTTELPTERKFGGLWHLIQDTTDNTAIRVRPIRDGDPSDYGQVTILKNRSKVKCNQILPFTHEGRSLFLMIYSTDFHREEDVSTWRCTRYHVFSVDDLFK